MAVRAVRGADGSDAPLQLVTGRLVQIAAASGKPAYIDPTEIVVIGPTQISGAIKTAEGTTPGIQHRRVLLRGGGFIDIADTRENLKRLLQEPLPQ